MVQGIVDIERLYDLSIPGYRAYQGMRYLGSYVRFGVSTVCLGIATDP